MVQVAVCKTAYAGSNPAVSSMAMLEISPIIPRAERRMTFTSPTGTYYMIGTPSLELAEDLIAAGIERVVWSGSARSDWPEVECLLLDAGITIVSYSEE